MSQRKPPALALRRDSQALAELYIEACECELRAFKPGNVSVHAEGHGMRVEDFRQSAQVSAPFLADARLSLGERILQAARATREAVDCNTNLGILLLAAPLLRAVETCKAGQSLRAALRDVLSHSTREDAERVYQAIRLAQPGGLGESKEQDVRDAPTITLLEAMRIAEHRDRIAYQYTSGYRDVFDFAIPRYHNALSRWDDEAWAAVAVFLGFLQNIPDSHVERKFGTCHTRTVAARAARLEQVLSESPSPELALGPLREVDAEFKACGINPGTSADLTVGCLLAVRLERMVSRHAQEAPGIPEA